jgi:lipopolysaccharide transport system ATP-binding protein
MSIIELQNVNLSFPLNTHGTSSLRSVIVKKVANKIVGKEGKISEDGRYLNALRSISLSIENGRRVGIIGANGAGKTTLLKVISEIYEPTNGQVKIEGRLGSFLSLGLGSHHEYTGLESIRNQLLLLGHSKKHIESITPAIIEFSELGDLIHLPIKRYSAGMQMRLNFSILAEVNPEIVIMDEWLSTGDLYFVEKAQKKVQEIVNQAHILVLGSHDLALLEKVCTDIVYMEDGQIFYHGKPSETIQIYKERTAERRAP